MPKPSVPGALAQNAVWYSLLAVLAIIVIFSLGSEQPLQTASAASDPAYDSTNSGITTQRPFTRGISESLSVTSTFGAPAAPAQSFTRTISDSVGMTSSFAPPQSQVPRTTLDNNSNRSSQYYQGPGQRLEERLNLKNLANTKADTINGKGYNGGTSIATLSESNAASSIVISNAFKELESLFEDSASSEDGDSHLEILSLV